MISDDFSYIHESLIESSKPYLYLNKLLKENGVQCLKKTNLDLSVSLGSDIKSRVDGGYLSSDS